MAKCEGAPEGEAVPRVGEMSEEEIDYNVMETFPASDPPAWTTGIRRRKLHCEEFGGEKPSASAPSHQNEAAPPSDPDE